MLKTNRTKFQFAEKAEKLLFPYAKKKKIKSSLSLIKLRALRPVTLLLNLRKYNCLQRTKLWSN